MRIGSELALPRLACAVLALTAAPAHAAHPLISEDPDTQGRGHFELELGFQDARDGDLRAFEFGPQLSYGVTDSLDGIVRPAWIDNRSTGDAAPPVRALSDTALDVKWRFFERDALSAGVRAGLLIPTGDADRGAGQGKASWHAVLAGQWSAAPWTFIGNVGYVQDPVAGERASLWYTTASIVWAQSERWRFSAETAGFTPPDTARNTWQAVARFGAIATLAPWLDVDAGYQFRLNRAAPVKVILAGATIRW